MATAAVARLPHSSKPQKKKQTAPIRDVRGYINAFTNKFCRQYDILHWQEDVANECMMKWWKASQNHPKKMNDGPYAKRVIFNAAIQWEKRYRDENHFVSLNDVMPFENTSFCNEAFLTPEPALEFDLGLLHGLNDVECLILEMFFGFGRSEGYEFSITQIARRLKHSETWVRELHAHALRVVKTNLQ